MAIDRGDVHGFQDKVGSGNGLYIKGKDFEKARKVRPILWLYKGKPIDILMYLEGWVNAKDAKGKPLPNGKPIRFGTSDVIPDGLDWKMSSFKGAAAKAQIPKPTVSFICWDYLTKSIKVASFSQVSVTGHIANMLAPKDKDGVDNEMYVEDLTAIDLVILKGAEDSDPYTVTIKPLKDPSLLPETLKALSEFKWSWDAFMECENPTEGGSVIDYNDVVDVAGGTTEVVTSKPTSSASKSTPAKAETPVVEGESYVYDPEWAAAKTPKGKLLKDCTDEELEGFKTVLDKMKADGKKVSDTLYNAICSGLKDKSESSGQSEEDEVAF
jgi:hypothetical protein